MKENLYNDIFLEMLSEIELALEHKLYIAALCIAVTIPDICGKAEYNKDSRYNYTHWYDVYIGDKVKPGPPYGEDMPYLSGEVLYTFRNSLLHNGNPNITKEKIQKERCKIDHFELVVGEDNYHQSSQVKYSGNQIYYRYYKMNVNVFCNNIIRAAREYYGRNKERFNFDYSFFYEVIP